MSLQDDRPPVQAKNKQGRTLFYFILATIIALLVVFLVLRARGTQAVPQDQITHTH